MSAPLPCPVGLDELIDYFVGELDPERAARVEDHVFECASCADPFASIDRLRQALVETVRCAEIGCNVGATFLERAVRDGLTVKEYLIAEGQTVDCKAGPEDLVLVRLEGGFGDAEELELGGELEDLESDTRRPLPGRRVLVDRDLDQVLLVFPGKLVRTYPRSRWTLSLSATGTEGPSSHGPFVMDHRP